MSNFNIKELNRKQLQDLLVSMGEAKFREKQISSWLAKGVESFDEMTDLSKNLREKLAKSCTIEGLKVELQQISKDGTRKFLLKCLDGEYIEAVFMSYDYGNSLCISTQVGCNMGCKFCASTIGGKHRDLKAWEMLDEFLVIRKAAESDINHIVLMGMGEPFDNYEEVSEFLQTIHDPNGINLSYRNITVSTCGLVPMIKRFGEDFPQVNLAISLHAANQEAREKIMPIAKKYSLDQLMAACKEHEEKTGRRISYEYTLILGKNDREEDAKALASLLKGQLCHVNLIPLNIVEETGLAGSSREAAQSFASRLEKLGIPATVRRELGSDIDAACGQLRKKQV